LPQLRVGEVELLEGLRGTGSVLSVATNYTGGAGALVNPYVTTQTELRATPVKRVIYYPGMSGNSYLGAKSYRVADLGGNAGQGGILKPYTGRGTVITIR
jgi:hypothetical protein